MYSICTCSFLVSGTSKTLLFKCEPWIWRLLFSSCLFLEEKTFNFVFFANEEDESAQIIFTERWFVWCCCCCELIWYEVYTPLAYDIALRCHVKNRNTQWCKNYTYCWKCTWGNGQDAIVKKTVLYNTVLICGKSFLNFVWLLLL